MSGSVMSGREARARLEHAGISGWRARSALECGLAGPPVRTRSIHLYEADRVEALANRRVVDPWEMRTRAPEGFLLSRRAVSVDVSHAELLEELSAMPHGMSPYRALSLRFADRHVDGLPFVATVAGFVVLGAEIRGLKGRTMLLRPPGAWFDGMADVQFPTGQGRPWTLQEPRMWRTPPPRRWG
jgi:hypothetical protein